MWEGEERGGRNVGGGGVGGGGVCSVGGGGAGGGRGGVGEECGRGRSGRSGVMGVWVGGVYNVGGGGVGEECGRGRSRMGEECGGGRERGNNTRKRKFSGSHCKFSFIPHTCHCCQGYKSPPPLAVPLSRPPWVCL